MCALDLKSANGIVEHKKGVFEACVCARVAAKSATGSNSFIKFNALVRC